MPVGSVHKNMRESTSEVDDLDFVYFPQIRSVEIAPVCLRVKPIIEKMLWRSPLHHVVVMWYLMPPAAFVIVIQQALIGLKSCIE